jgi:hypothetical protein
MRMARVLEMFLTGMATGALVGLLMSSLGAGFVMRDAAFALSMFFSMPATLLYLGIPLASAFSVRWVAKKLWRVEARLAHLIPVSFLVLMIPVLNPVFSGSNEMYAITLLGAIDGLFWSTPLVLWRDKKLRRGTFPPPDLH